MDLFVNIRNLGFILHPVVTNNTYVTQLLEKNYGIFKSEFQNKLYYITIINVSNNKFMLLPLCIFGFLVFVETDTHNGCTVSLYYFKE